MEIKLFNWIINLLILSLPFSWYMCYNMYNDLKKKDKIIELQNRMLENKTAP
jgi:hypothetical protein